MKRAKARRVRILIRRALVSASVSLLTLVPLQLATTGLASAATSCSGNSVIANGASTIAELKQQYTANHCDVRAVYNYFGITSASDFDGMVAGYVTNTNKVYVNTDNRLVATNAYTAGRDNISNANGTSIAILGGKFYKRPPAVSFTSEKLAALVKLDGNGVFQFAVITSCGNPVVATAVTPKPKPTPQPTPAPTTPAPTPTPPAKLPDTGAGSSAALFIGVAAVGTIARWIYLKRKLSTN